ncbi:MAG: GntR family transcriptional regulator [Bryobacteraceae bacterium]
MIPFRVSFEPGTPIYEQVAYAAKKAIVSGQMRSGDPFPSVRVLSAALKINPNTAHKVIAHLVEEGVLEVRSGIGTVVAGQLGSSAAKRSNLLKKELEQLVVEAKKLGLDLEDVAAALDRHWKRLERGEREPNPPDHPAFETIWQDAGPRPSGPDHARGQRLRVAGAKRRG